MRRFLAGLMALLMLLALFRLLFPEAWAEEPEPGYTLIAMPEIAESEWPAELFCAHVMRVDIDRRAVAEDRFVRVYLLLPYSSDQVYDVLLTDGTVWAHAEMEQLKHTLLLTFDTETLRQMDPDAWTYLVVVAIA